MKWPPHPSVFTINIWHHTLRDFSNIRTQWSNGIEYHQHFIVFFLLTYLIIFLLTYSPQSPALSAVVWKILCCCCCGGLGINNLGEENGCNLLNYAPHHGYRWHPPSFLLYIVYVLYTSLYISTALQKEHQKAIYINIIYVCLRNDTLYNKSSETVKSVTLVTTRNSHWCYISV